MGISSWSSDGNRLVEFLTIHMLFDSIEASFSVTGTLFNFGVQYKLGRFVSSSYISNATDSIHLQ